MKILHVIFSFCSGGAENMLIDILNHQAMQLDDSISLLIINKEYTEGLINQINSRIKVIRVDRKRSSKNIFDLLRLNYIVFHERPDIIHCHDLNAIKYLFIHKFYRTIATVHTSRANVSGIKHYNEVVSISKTVAKSINQKHNKTDKIIYNGIETSALKTNLPKLSTSRNEFHIVQVSRLESEIKGQHIALNALSILKEQLPSMHIFLDFIGSGSSANRLRKQSEQLGLGKQVRFLGAKDRHYIYASLNTYDLLIQPSIFEGFGLTVAEGMAAGLPVLVSDSEGPMEVIDNGTYGYHFHNSEAKDMALKLNYIINHPEEVLMMAEKGRAHALAKFDIATTVEQYREIYIQKRRKNT